jgi:uncharacterized membrane protein
MKSALLRALLWGTIAFAAGVALNEANFRVDGGGEWLEEVNIGIALGLVVGIEFACVGYLTHPTAWIPSVRPPAVRFLGRIFIGTLFGLIPATAVLVGTSVVCLALDLQIKPGDPSNPSSSDKAVYLAEFMILTACTATLAAAWCAAAVAERECEVRRQFKRIVLNAIMGTIAGGWLGAGTGLVVVNFARSWHVNVFPELTLWLAILTGLGSGILAAMMLRVRRSRLQ